MKGDKRYTVDGWDDSWFVESRNHRTVAKCPSKRWADKIAKLLNEDLARKEHYGELEGAQQ